MAEVELLLLTFKKQLIDTKIYTKKCQWRDEIGALINRQKTRKQWGNPLDTLVFVSVGELNRNKNHEVGFELLHLRIFPIPISKRAELSLYGNEMKGLESLISEYGLDQGYAIINTVCSITENISIMSESIEGSSEGQITAMGEKIIRYMFIRVKLNGSDTLRFGEGRFCGKGKRRTQYDET